MTALTAAEILSRKYRGKTTVDRFREKIKKTETCWFWTGAINAFGYGAVRIKADLWPAHRLSWVIHNGNIPSGLYVLHKCDVRNCVRPDHLFLGTYADNLHDAMEKGRWIAVRGEAVGTAKFTENQIAEMKSLWLTGQFTKTALAQRFGTSDTLIRYVVTGKYWRHVKPLDHSTNHLTL